MSNDTPFWKQYHIPVSDWIKIQGVYLLFSSEGVFLSNDEPLGDGRVFNAIELALKMHELIVTTLIVKAIIQDTPADFHDEQIESFLGFVVPQYVQWFMSIPDETRVFIDSVLEEAYERSRLKMVALQVYPIKRPIGELRHRPGFVYLLKAQNGYYKIGRTKNPDDRLRTFNVKLPFEIEFVHLVECNDMYAVESGLHDRYMRKRVNGEWFSLNERDVEWIKALGDHIGRWLGEEYIIGEVPIVEKIGQPLLLDSTRAESAQ